MVTTEEDEFGNVYAEVCREEGGALRGFGSLKWACEDDSDSPPHTKGCSECASEDCHAAETKKQCIDGVQEEAEAPSGTFEVVPSAQDASKQDQITMISISNHALKTARVVEGVDTDSDDDLHIVLNPLEEVGSKRINEDSDDEEDFVILTGSETMNDREWKESLCILLEAKAQSLLEGGEKIAMIGDEKGQNGKSPRVQPRIGYGSQAYRRHYQYVRGSGPSIVGANKNGRVNGTSDRFGSWQGFSNRERVSLPMHRSSTVRGGLSCGLEYSIPSNKTVFDVDMDALQEKPWRLSHVDLSDYFNFGFDEASWKSYCKQLAQFCLEITTKSKISVYEGGRGGQSTMSASQGGRGAEPWLSANSEELQAHECDAIFLIDAKADRISQSCSERYSVDLGEATNFLQDDGSPKSDIPLESKRGMCETTQPTEETANQTYAEHQKYGAGSRNETQVDGTASICPEDGLATPSASRAKILSPSTPPERLPGQDKRQTKRRKSQSSSLNDGLQLANEDYLYGPFQSYKVLGRMETFKLDNHVKACGRRRVNAALTHCERNCGRLGTKRCHTPAITTPLSKKQRLGLQKVNHGSHYSTRVAKKSSRPQTAAAVLGACKAYAKTKITQHKRYSSINNAIECLNCDKSVDQHGDKSTEQPNFEKANLIPSKVEIKISEKHDEADSNEMNGRLQAILSESSDEKLEEVKAKKSRKARKCKKRIKSRECPNIEKGQLVGFGNTVLIQKQGAEKVSMISFVSKGNCFYWRKVENMSQCQYQGKNLKKLKSCKHHELNQKTKAKIKILKRNDCPLGHLEIGGDKELQNEVLKPDGDTPLEAATSWQTFQVSKSKKMRVKHIVMGDFGVAPTCSQAVANLISETHASNSMQVAFNKWVSTRPQQKYCESKERQSTCKHCQLQAEDKANGHTDVEVPLKRSHKKICSKKQSKSSSRNSDELIVSSSDKQRHYNGTLNVALAREPTNVKNGATSPVIRGRMVGRSDFKDTDRKADFEICQLKLHSPKACGNILPNFSADTPHGKKYVGFDMTSKSPILSSDSINGKSKDAFDISRLQENHSLAEGLFVEQETTQATFSESSEEEVKQRGRSKFERWTSHSEQAPSDLKVGRISLSRRVQASKYGHPKKHLDESAPECTKQVEDGTGREWTFARKQKGNLGRTCKETANLSIRESKQHAAQQDHLDHFVAMLEKRRQRFKLLPTEEASLLGSLALKDERESLQRSSSIKFVPSSQEVAVELEQPA